MNPETAIQKNLCTPMFIAVLFTIAKYWKQPKCPSVNEWIKKLLHLHNGILCSRKKEGSTTLHDSMNGTGERFAKWNDPGSERQIPYDLTFSWNLINKTNKQAKYNRDIEIKNKPTEGEVGGDHGEKRGKGHQQTHIKDTWTKTNREKSEGGWWGCGNGDNCTWTIKKIK